jgi:hypothetical protein
MCCCVNQIAHEVIRRLNQEQQNQHPVFLAGDDKHDNNHNNHEFSGPFAHSISIKSHLNKIRAFNAAGHASSTRDSNLKWPTNGDNDGRIVSNTNAGIHSWSLDNGNELNIISDDSMHFHLSFQSRVGPVQWLK